MLKKRLFSWLLAAVLTLSLLPTPSLAASSYNADKALAYAKAHWDDGKGLCAEFVSDCLRAGGLTSWHAHCRYLFNQLNRVGKQAQHAEKSF